MGATMVAARERVTSRGPLEQPMTQAPTARDKILRRFWDKVEFGHGPSACWLWVGARQRDLYGRFMLNARQVFAHRVAFMLFCDEDPTGKHVHHECENPACVNPAHLQAVLPDDHPLPSRIRSGASTCKRGHPKEPGGACRTCAVERYSDPEYKRRKREYMRRRRLANLEEHRRIDRKRKRAAAARMGTP